MKEGYVLKADAAKYLTPEPITYEVMKRKSEKAAQTALKDAKASILNAAGIGKVEAYCINTVLAELKRKGLSPEQEEYKRIIGITDGGQPIFCIEISNKTDLNEKEIAAAAQDEREAKQR